MGPLGIFLKFVTFSTRQLGMTSVKHFLTVDQCVDAVGWAAGRASGL